MSCSSFKPAGSRDECLTCGQNSVEHGLPPPPVSVKVQAVRILFAGKFYEFKDWQEARKKGFYLG